MDNELLTNFCIAAMGVDGDITDEEIDRIVEVLDEFGISEDEISDAVDEIENFDIDQALDDFTEMTKADQKKLVQTMKKILTSDGMTKKEGDLIKNLQKIADAS
ncbi:TerB family tellurite resistance protein [Leptospira sp. 96542]|nr:TerB family tellurite resistance protein [Leptospira sp. 96542]